MENELRVITDNSTTFSFRIIANGPLNTGIKDRCVVYVEINKRENVLEERIPLKIDFPEYSIPVRRISEMNLDEVSSEKVRQYLQEKRTGTFSIYTILQTARRYYSGKNG